MINEEVFPAMISETESSLPDNVPSPGSVDESQPGKTPMSNNKSVVYQQAMRPGSIHQLQKQIDDDAGAPTIEGNRSLPTTLAPIEKKAPETQPISHAQLPQGM